MAGCMEGYHPDQWEWVRKWSQSGTLGSLGRKIGFFQWYYIVCPHRRSSGIGRKGSLFQFSIIHFLSHEKKHIGILSRARKKPARRRLETGPLLPASYWFFA
jgi:hypothetical protein